MATIAAVDAGGQNVPFFLDLIAWSETTSNSSATKNDGYDVIVTGQDMKTEVFTDYSDHPFASGRPSKIIRATPKLITSSASGRYQLELRWWRAYRQILNLPDFSPLSQDKVAVRQIRECHAIDLINSGSIQDAITACSSRWASFPGNAYGQNPHAIEALLAKWDDITGLNVLEGVV